jgi:RimJ/RimL family protein N-acetyltransferase
MDFSRVTDFKDIQQLTNLLHRAYQADEKLQIHFKAANITNEQVRQHIQTTPTFAIKSNDRIAATASVRLPWSTNPGPFDLPHLGWIATDPEFQHQGLAKKIIQFVIDDFVIQQLSAPAISLGTAVEHPWLQTAYRSIGFKQVDTVRMFSDHQTVFMIKVLNDQAIKTVNDTYLQSVI